MNFYNTTFKKIGIFLGISALLILCLNIMVSNIVIAKADIDYSIQKQYTKVVRVDVCSNKMKSLFMAFDFRIPSVFSFNSMLLIYAIEIIKNPFYKFSTSKQYFRPPRIA